MDEAERLCSRIAIMDHGRIIALGSPRALIAEHIEPQVVEVHGQGLVAWLPTAAPLALRREHVGETLFCYAADPEPLLAQLRGRADLTYIHRPANLEDVFLKLTGRDLRD
jgi:lipooligosaccharide transport system ATP-binding protein